MEEIDILNRLLVLLCNNPKHFNSAHRLGRDMESPVNVEGFLEKLSEEKLAIKRVVKSPATGVQEHSYCISITGWNLVKNLPEMYKNAPYRVYEIKKNREATVQKIKEDREDRKLRIDLSNAERVYSSYNVTRIIAWASLIITIVATYLKAAESKHLWPYR